LQGGRLEGDAPTAVPTKHTDADGGAGLRQIFVFFPDEPKVGVKTIKQYAQMMKDENVTRAVLVVQVNLTPHARQSLVEVQSRFLLEQVRPCHTLGDAESSLGYAKSSRGDAKSSLGDAKSSLGDAESSLGYAKSSRGDAKSSLGDAKSSLGDAKSSLGDDKSSRGDA
jgi:hypothetical protein